MACRHLLVLAVLTPGATAAAAKAGEREKGRETEWGGTKGREGPLPRNPRTCSDAA